MYGSAMYSVMKSDDIHVSRNYESRPAAVLELGAVETLDCFRFRRDRSFASQTHDCILSRRFGCHLGDFLHLDLRNGFGEFLGWYRLDPEETLAEESSILQEFLPSVSAKELRKRLRTGFSWGVSVKEIRKGNPSGGCSQHHISQRTAGFSQPFLQ